MGNELILENLGSLLKRGENEVIIRFPVIPGVTDSEENIRSILEFLSDFQNVREIDILPYHDVKEKYKRLGKEYDINETKTPGRERIERIKEKFEDEGYLVKEGG